MKTKKRTRLGRDIEKALKELAAYLRGTIQADVYKVRTGRRRNKTR